MATAVEHPYDIAPRLDLACPIPWPRSASAATGSIIDASPTPKARIATTSTIPHVPLEAACCSPTRWLERRYAETLWLGEAHSPLSAFLSHIQHLERRLASPSRTTDVLRKLLRSRQQVRERLSGSSTSADGYAACSGILALLVDEEDEDEASQEDSQAAGSGAGEDMAEQKRREAYAVRAALREGPAKAVAADVRRCTPDSAFGRLGRLWIDAIETRELQLQVLVILSLLRLNAEHPALAQQGEQASHDSQSEPPQPPLVATAAPFANDTFTSLDTSDSSASQPKKRKRKAEHSQRWTGRNGIFPWQIGRPSTVSDTFAVGSAQDRPDASSIEPEALAKRFESLLDVLSLRVATTIISLDLDGVDDEQDNGIAGTPRTPGESPATAARQRRQAGHRVVIPPFGSEGRRREGAKDERDVMQWFCCHIVETHFSKSLPRQCGIIRSRCFVPSSSTPAKAAVSKKATMTMTTTTKPRSMSSSKLQASLLDYGTNENVAQPRAARQETSRRPSVSLERSLLKETKSQLQRTQSMAAAKLRSTYDAREVNVRKRWERSHSVGPTASAALSGSNSVLSDTVHRKVAAATHSLSSTTMRPLLLLDDDKHSLFDHSSPPPRHADRTASDRQPYILALSTPSKPRPVNVLQARKRSN